MVTGHPTDQTAGGKDRDRKRRRLLRPPGGGRKGGIRERTIGRAGGKEASCRRSHAAAAATSPGLSAEFRVDILEHGDEVIVVAELPGAEKDEIRINLLNPQILRITARRAGPVEEEPGGKYYVHERGDGTLSRMIRLPASVVEEGAGTRFKNGVLEIRLKKMRRRSGPGGKKIPIG
ncbi:Hsp20 family protein [Methanoculleus chikugoensis]|uniref:Hsp20/alpha crystallin family protein n=1 Tax=Methanoculleus chikugoensis TaxID=118126 RepID=UPI0006CF61CC|nr:Hsp20/alpha crystallin family protein [Methanoculleus chikugoensis]